MTVRVTNAGPGAGHAARAADRVVPQHVVVGRRRTDAPQLPRRTSDSGVGIDHPFLGDLELLAGAGPGRRPRRRCCSARTRRTPQRLFGDRRRPRRTRRTASTTTSSHGAATVNPDARRHQGRAAGTGSTVEPGETVELRLRLRPTGADAQPAAALGAGLRRRASRPAAPRPTSSTPSSPRRTRRPTRPTVMRQAFAGMLWSKQLYDYDVARWLDGDPGQPPPPASRHSGRNADWRNFDAFDIMSMPDKWEYPWFAAWDLAFHCVALAHVDPAFAKYQLRAALPRVVPAPQRRAPRLRVGLRRREPAGAGVGRARGVRDRRRPRLDFLSRVFDKLLVNFTWWVNREDADGSNLFEGGFLGLDNIGPIDRSHLPVGGHARAVRRHRVDGVVRAGDGGDRVGPDTGPAAPTDDLVREVPRALRRDPRRDRRLGACGTRRTGSTTTGSTLPTAPSCRSRSARWSASSRCSRRVVVDEDALDRAESLGKRFAATSRPARACDPDDARRRGLLRGEPGQRAAAARRGRPRPARPAARDAVRRGRVPVPVRAAGAVAGPPRPSLPARGRRRRLRPSTTSRPSRPPRCSAATRTGAARSGSRSTTSSSSVDPACTPLPRRRRHRRVPDRLRAAAHARPGRRRPPGPPDLAVPPRRRRPAAVLRRGRAAAAGPALAGNLVLQRVLPRRQRRRARRLAPDRLDRPGRRPDPPYERLEHHLTRRSAASGPCSSRCQRQHGAHLDQGAGRMAEHYDVIIIGSGAGGGTLAHTLAPSGKKILLLERGDFLPRRAENWDPAAGLRRQPLLSKDTWYDADGKPFQPQVHYFVGGATKMYGAALYRLRPQDFGELKHVDGISPAWPLSYDDFEPYYTKAEQLYQVHGNRGEDPTEAAGPSPYPFPAVSHEPRIQQLADDLRSGGYHPFHSPCGIMLNEAQRPTSTLHPLHVVRRLSLPRARQVRRRSPRRPAGPRSPERHAARRTRGACGSRPTPAGRSVTGVVVLATVRTQRVTRPTSSSSRPARRTRRSCCCFGQRQASARPRQRFRPGRPQLHVPQQPGGPRALEGAERHDLPEDARPERLLLRHAGLRVPDGQHPDGRQVAGRADVPRREADRDELAPQWSLERSPEHAVDFWLRPKICRGRRTASPSTATATFTSPTRPTNDAEADRLYDKLKSMLNQLDMHDHLIPQPLHEQEHRSAASPTRPAPAASARSGDIGARRRTARPTSSTTCTSSTPASSRASAP